MILFQIDIPVSKQWRAWSDTAFCDVWSGSALFAYVPKKWDTRLIWVKQVKLWTVCHNYYGGHSKLLFRFSPPGSPQLETIGSHNTVVILSFWTDSSGTPTHHSDAKLWSIQNVHKRSFWFSITGVKTSTPSLELREIFSLKSIYVKYNNAILSHIDCFFSTWKN